MAQLFLIAWLAAFVHAAYPQSPEQGTQSLTRETGPVSGTNEEIDPDAGKIGAVTLSKRDGTATFAGAVNMDQGVIEYLLVGSAGKTHESLLVTEIEPYHLHLAMLLLGAKGNQSNTTGPSGAIDSNYLKSAPDLKGDQVSIFVSWKSGGKKVEARAEQLVANLKTKTRASPGSWIYTGSQIIDRSFSAQKEQSFIAMITDPDALINNPRPGHDDDRIWSVNSSEVPPLLTPVEITIKLEHFLNDKAR